MKKEMEGVKGKGKGKKDDGGKGKEEVEMSELLMVCRRDLERLDVGEGNVESEGEEKSEEGEEGLWTPTESVAGEGEGSH